MKEIGSEFWTIDLDDNDNKLEFLNIGEDYKMLMSGRTAIDYVLQDFEDNVKIVYMPNYCCESMVKPFLDNGYQIEYYNVDVLNKKYEIDLGTKCSVFFAMSYFGYNESTMDKQIESFSKRGIVIIEDITHRLLSNNNHCKYSNYLIASLRKWFPIISGGLAVNIKNTFINDLENYEVDSIFVQMKKQAMDLKRDYIKNDIDNKSEFLELYNKTNQMVDNYRNKKIDDESLKVLKSLNIDLIKKQRINNCLLIEKELKNNDNIRLLYNLKSGDCPLFVPIIIKERDATRKELINNKIYLPIHWPNELNICNDIYMYELSLICDQRYNEKNIKEYIDIVKKIAGRE